MTDILEEAARYAKGHGRRDQSRVQSAVVADVRPMRGNGDGTLGLAGPVLDPALGFDERNVDGSIVGASNPTEKLGKPIVQLANGTVLRAARDSDVEAICALIDEPWTGFVDWAGLGAWWIVVEKDGVVVGCVQSMIAKPVGRAEFLCINTELTDREQAKTAKALIDFVLSTNRNMGIRLVTWVIEFGNKKMKRAAKRRGAIVANQGHILLMPTQMEV